MSTLGHKQTSASGLGMSAYPHLADMLDAECHKRTSIRALNFVMMTPGGEVFSRTRSLRSGWGAFFFQPRNSEGGRATGCSSLLLRRHQSFSRIWRSKRALNLLLHYNCARFLKDAMMLSP